MNDLKVHAAFSVVSELVQQIDALWEYGQSADPDVLLNEAGLSAPAVIARVLTADQWHRWHAGERFAVESYFERHPAAPAGPLGSGQRGGLQRRRPEDRLGLAR
jgi:hypothetical protein